MKIHFISIGGSVMHQLAIALHKKGYEVTGSDDEIFEPAAGNLAAEGILPPALGWHPERITSDVNAVILGMHAKADNPELIYATSLGLPIYSFPEYIFQESKDKNRIVVGGSHGKTTTTSMIMHALRQLNKAFDYLVGAKLEGFSQSVKITDAPLIICEGDEYPASAIERHPKFHFLYPHIAILTGIAWDHINVFPTFDFYLEQFVIFINKIETGGVLIYNEDDQVLKQLVEDNLRTDIRYQPYSVPQHQIVNGITHVKIDGVEGQLNVFGNHNLLNLFAAYYACKELGVSAADFVHVMHNFKGAAKRLELLASNHNINIYRDFAHAPSKVKASVEAVKQQFPDRTLFGILELHTFSSLNEAFMPQFNGTFDQVDVGVVFYSNHALALKRMPELSAEKVLDGFNKPGLIVLNQKSDLQNWLSKQNFNNSNILFMSSGNFDGIDIHSFAQQIIQS